MGQVIIEILDEHGQPREHRVYDRFVVKIGRAYSNDCIIYDPYVSAVQLTVRLAEGGWRIENLSDVNPVCLNGTPVVESAFFKSGDRVRIGKTTLRILTPSHPVPPALVLEGEPKHFAVGSTFTHAVWPLLGLYLVVFGWEKYLHTYETVSVGKTILPVLGGLLIMLVWAGIWSFIGRLIRRKPHFAAQLSIACAFSVAMLLSRSLTSNLVFYTNSTFVTDMNSVALMALIFTYFLSRTLGYATHMSVLKQWIVSMVITLVILAGVLTFYFSFKEEINAGPQFDGSLKPPFAGVMFKDSLADFFKDSEKVFEVEEKK